MKSDVLIIGAGGADLPVNIDEAYMDH